ncbi:MAG: glycosyl hydrolase family 95 catalytic domain-containing protein [Fermentimonas sp.]
MRRILSHVLVISGSILLMISFISGCTSTSEGDIKVPFDSPASNWNEAIPIGNGSIGGMVYGGIKSDTIKINEETLWSGGPRDLQFPEAKKYLPKIRELLLEDKNNEAEKLIDSHWLGPYNEEYQQAGDLILNMDGNLGVTNYKRELDLSNGLVNITYSIGNVNYKREIFASHPDEAIIIRLSASRPGNISFSTSLTSALKHDVKVENNQVILNGRAMSNSSLHRKYAYYKSDEGTDLSVKYPEYEDGKGMFFQIRMLVRQKGGTSAGNNGSYTVSNADEVELILTAATSYNGFDKNPFTDGKDYAKICADRIKNAEAISYKKLKQAHIDDYTALFSRVSLNFGDNPRDTIPFPKRLELYKQDSDDVGLTALYFHFGRYLLISSSRPGGQAANLQGIWTNTLHPPWSSNWTLNHNAQINYWPAEVCNLSECHLPLIELTKELSIDGAKTAKNLYGCPGWIAHHNADIWRTTWPVWGTGMWAIYQIGSAWLCHHLWQHYEFTLNKEYLADVYQVMKDAAVFYMCNLQRDREGYLVTSPSISLEHTFKKPDGTVGWACMGSAEDMQAIRDLFQNCKAAATVLNTDEDFKNELDKYMEQLAPIKISPSTGRLQEWNDDWEPAGDPRQVSHGWGLHAGNQISPRTTPELADAYRKTLEHRTPWKYLAASWCGSTSAMNWVRLGDGNLAQEVFDLHFKTAVFPNLTSCFKTYIGNYFQIDGNLGITASIAEMLLQSHLGEIEILPALPDKYPTGEVKGLRARGGFVVDIKWDEGKLVNVKVKSNNNNTCKLRYKNYEFSTDMKIGDFIILDNKLQQ